MAIGRPLTLTPNIATKNISVAATADQTEFTVAGGYRINEIAVYRNGVRLVDSRDYTASDGSIVTLSSGATVSDIIEFSIFDSFNVSAAIVSAASTQNIDGNLNVTGNLYAGSFIGDGSGLTGVANTDYIVSVATTTGDLTVSAAATIGGITKITDTTNSTSSSTGALVVSGGVGIAASLTVAGSVSIGGTLTYEDVTNVDSVGLVTARSGVNISGGQLQVGVAYSVGNAGVATAAGFVGDLTGDVTAATGSFSSNLTVGSGITMGSAGVATFSGTSDVHLTDGVQLKMGDSSDFQLYHDGTKSIIKNTTGALILHGASVLIKNEINNEVGFSFTEDGTVELHYDDSKKLETTNTGETITGNATATKFLGDGSALTGVGGDTDITSCLFI